MQLRMHCVAIAMQSAARARKEPVLPAPAKMTQTCRVATNDPRQLSLGTDGWHRQQLPSALGECYSEQLCLAADLLLVRSLYRPNRPLLEATASPHARQMLVMTFGLRGTSGYRGTDGSAIAFQAGHTTITAFRASAGERCYAADTDISQLRLLIGPDLLRSYIGEQRTAALLGSGQLHHLQFSQTSPACHALARELSQGGDRLRLHIRSLSLLAEQLERLSPTPSLQQPKFSLNDIEKLEQVRQLMLDQLDQPLTLAYLAASVGFNEFKLKEGFRHHYQTSPYRLLTELRMRKAHALLENGCQVAQAGYQVGYAFANNFSAAFTRFFGKSPKSVFGKRR